MSNLKEWLNKHNITNIEAVIPDLAGMTRGKFIRCEDFIGQNIKLSEGVLLQTISGNYCDQHFDLVSDEDSDMLIKANEDTIRLVPWANQATAQVIHDCYTPEGDRHPLSSRNVLRHVLDEYEKRGLKPIIAPEVEFYLLENNIDYSKQLQPPMGQSGRPTSIKQPLGIEAAYEFDDFINTVYEYAKAQNLSVGTLSYETGAAQMEFNFAHGDALDLADQVFVYKRTIKKAAQKHGYVASFMAKPMADQSGSSLHIHQSVIDCTTGSNIFSSDSGEKTQAFMSYIAGLQKYTPKLMSLYAPNINSYRRFTRYINAPSNLHWGYDNRTVAFRVPDADAVSTRVENRFSGIDANPYLAIAASLASGLAGMNNKLKPTQAFTGTVENVNPSIAQSLDRALDNLLDLEDFGELISTQFLTAYCAVKRKEYEEYNQVISAWEREYLVSNV